MCGRRDGAHAPSSLRALEQKPDPAQDGNRDDGERLAASTPAISNEPLPASAGGARGAAQAR
jgi:hypothetical protein